MIKIASLSGTLLLFVIILLSFESCGSSKASCLSGCDKFYQHYAIKDQSWAELHFGTCKAYCNSSSEQKKQYRAQVPGATFLEFVD